MKVKIRWDENLGYYAGIVVVLIVGKYYFVPYLGTWEIVDVLFRGLMRW